jgi:glycosyltransferase involved in cell wall biosynthesis
VRCIIHTFHGHLFHSYYNSFITGILKLTERLLGKITTKVVALSVSQFKDLTEVYKIIQPSKCSVIPLGIEHEKYLDKNTFSRRNFREQYQLRNSTIAIGIVGRMVPVKNHKLFVDIIVRLVKKSRKDIRFFFIGDGQLKRTIQQHLTQSGISWSEQNSNSNSTVIFTSWVSNIKESLHGIDILVLTSFNEGTPLSIIEAQLCGKPVVAANVGGVTDTFLNNETGFLINGHDPEQYIEKIGLLVDDANLRNRMGQKGSEMAMQKFSKNQEVKALSELYTTCLKSSKT